MTYDKRALTGIGGWLAFFILTLAIISPVRGALNLYQLLAAPTPPEYAAGWPGLRIVAIAEFVLNAGLVWFMAWRLIQVRNRATVRIVIACLWLSAVVMQSLLMMLAIIVSGIPAAIFVPAAGVQVVQGMIYALIWTLYLRKSRRVANTYADEQDRLATVFG